MIAASGVTTSAPGRTLLLAPTALIIAIFLFAVGTVVVGSLRDASGGFSAAIYLELLRSPTIWNLTLQTVWVASLTTVICAVMGYPIALFIARSRRRNLMLVLVISPWLTSIVVRTFAWIVMLGNRGVVNNTLTGLGLTDRPVQFLYTPTGTIIGLVHVLLPFMVISVLAVLARVDRRLAEAGMSLGAGPFETFLRVTLPLSLPGVLSGCSLVYLIASGAIVTPLLLGGLGDAMLGTQIFQEIVHLFNFPRAAAMAMVLLVTSLVVVLPIQLLDARARKRLGGDA